MTTISEWKNGSKIIRILMLFIKGTCTQACSSHFHVLALSTSVDTQPALINSEQVHLLIAQYYHRPGRGTNFRVLSTVISIINRLGPRKLHADATSTGMPEIIQSSL